MEIGTGLVRALIAVVEVNFFTLPYVIRDVLLTWHLSSIHKSQNVLQIKTHRRFWNMHRYLACYPAFYFTFVRTSQHASQSEHIPEMLEWTYSMKLSGWNYEVEESCCAWDQFFQSCLAAFLETIVVVWFWVAECRELCNPQTKCDLINMSYGEPTSMPNYGRFVQLAEEVRAISHLSSKFLF